MVFQEFLLLQKMKKAQNTSSHIVCIDAFSGFVYTSGVSRDYRKIVPLPEFISSDVFPLLEGLECEGFILSVPSSGQDPIYKITHKGEHLLQRMVWFVLRFLCTSILVPIVVSIITTLIIARLQGWL